MSTGAERTRRWRERQLEKRRLGLVTARPTPAPKPPRVDALVRALTVSVPMPNLTGALCAGRSEIFDARREREPETYATERHVLAVELCGGCPARAPCGAWIAALPDHEKPSGVVAGQLNQP